MLNINFKKISVILIAFLTYASVVEAGWGLKDLDPTNKNSGIREVLKEADPFNKNSKVHQSMFGNDEQTYVNNIRCLKPGQTFTADATQKIDIWKRGPAPWNDALNEQFGGPDPHVDLILRQYGQTHILHSGPFSGSQQWKRSGLMTVTVTNTNSEKSCIFVALQNE